MPATCPFGIPVVTLPPQQVDGFSWGPVMRPQGDACLGAIAVEPADEQAWYVGSVTGLHTTWDGGQTWKKPLAGSVGPILLVPGSPMLVYVGIGDELHLSRDHGTTWTKLHTFDWTVRSLLVLSGRLYVGLHWGTHAVPSGVYSSNLGGGSWTFHAFGPGHSGLIVWTLAAHHADGTLYAGAEIYDHPQPYHPPFFRSTDHGATWANVAGPLPWHVIAAAVRPGDGYVYALTEGSGLYGSPDKGATWNPPAPVLAPSNCLLVNPKKPHHLFGGQQRYGTLPGGVFLSLDSGKAFTPIGRAGVTVSGLAVNGAATRLYATAYASGIYVSPIPATA